jgi:hypothetical protein
MPLYEVEGAEGGIMSCGEDGCGMAVTEADLEEEFRGGVAPITGDETVVVRPDTGEDGREPPADVVDLRPARNASRGEWDDFAIDIGIADAADLPNRDAVIAAVEARLAPGGQENAGNG